MRLHIYITCTCVQLFYSASRSLNRVIFFRYKLKLFDLLFECKSHFMENIYASQMNFLSIVDDKRYFFFFIKNLYIVYVEKYPKRILERVCAVWNKKGGLGEG